MFCEPSDLGLIKAEGNDAKKFLQGQLTCDVDAITVEHGSMGAHCNPQGRVISLFYLFLFHEAYYLLMQRSMIAIAMSALKKYAVFFKTEITDVSENLQAIMTQADPQEHWKTLMMRDELPSLYPETSSKFLPHEMNLHQSNAISFEKGCYTGQEIIARMHYRGKLKNHLYQALVSCEFTPTRGTDIYALQGEAWRSAGMVVDIAKEMYNHQYQLLIIANEVDNLFLTQDKNSILSIHRK